MNYYGFIIKEVRGIYKFLKKALSFIEEAKPFRGPGNFKERDFEYINKSEGEINKFKDYELILFKGEEVYRLEYQGGYL